jgi:Fanconi anemia group M protein
MKTLNSPRLLDIFSKKKLSQKKDEPKEKIVIDYREKNSLVASYLVKQGFEIEFKELKIGDYIVKDVIIERKTVQDFLNSMINHHLINQIEELKQYENKLLIIEGISDFELYSEEKPGINSNAVRGFLLSILLKHKIPLIFSKNSEDTAKFINVLSKKKENEINLNAKKKTLNKKEQLQFIIEGFPGVGPKKARKLLERFGNIQNIILAPTEELEKVLGKQASVIREIMERKY